MDSTTFNQDLSDDEYVYDNQNLSDDEYEYDNQDLSDKKEYDNQDLSDKKEYDNQELSDKKEYDNQDLFNNECDMNSSSTSKLSLTPTNSVAEKYVQNLLFVLIHNGCPLNRAIKLICSVCHCESKKKLLKSQLNNLINLSVKKRFEMNESLYLFATRAWEGDFYSNLETILVIVGSYLGIKRLNDDIPRTTKIQTAGKIADRLIRLTKLYSKCRSSNLAAKNLMQDVDIRKEIVIAFKKQVLKERNTLKIKKSIDHRARDQKSFVSSLQKSYYNTDEDLNFAPLQLIQC